jgi:hypothetical protein
MGDSDSSAQILAWVYCIMGAISLQKEGDA